jgi:hypothetical protein
VRERPELIRDRHPHPHLSQIDRGDAHPRDKAVAPFPGAHQGYAPPERETG